MLRFANAIIILAAACAAAAAQTPPATQPAKTAAYERVGAFVDDNTVALARLDAAKLDLQPIFDKVRYVVAQVSDDPKRTLAANLAVTGAQGLLAGMLQRFTAAGGRDVYGVFTLADAPAMPFFFVVPLEEKADEAAIRRLLSAEAPDVAANAPAGAAAATQPATTPTTGPMVKLWPEMKTWFREPVIEKHAGALFLGERRALERLKAAKPAGRAEIAAALAQAGDAAVAVAFSPSADARKVIREMTPTLPAEVGGQSSSVPLDGLVWAELALRTDAGIGLEAKIQSKDAQAAKDFQASYVVLLAKLQEQVKKELPALTADALGRLIDQLKKLRVVPDQARLELAFKSADIDAMLKDCAPLFAQARQNSRYDMSSFNVMAIGKALFIYQNEHKGFPDTLQDLLKAGLISQAALVNPGNPQQRPGYIYIKPALPAEKMDPNAVVLYEAYDKWPGKINVGYFDSHVGSVNSEQEFLKLLKDTASASQPASQPRPTAP